MIVVSGIRKQIRHILNHVRSLLRLSVALLVCACLIHSIDAERDDCGDLRGCASAAFPVEQVTSTYRLQRLLFAVTHDYELPEYSLEREKHDTHEVADEPERRRMLNACCENDSGVLVEVTADFLVSVSCIEVAAWKSVLYTAPAEFLIGHPKCAPPLALA